MRPRDYKHRWALGPGLGATTASTSFQMHMHGMQTHRSMWAARVRRRAGPSPASRPQALGRPSSCTDLGNTTPCPPTPYHLIYFRFCSWLL